jgi:hypothetical protein
MRSIPRAHSGTLELALAMLLTGFAGCGSSNLVWITGRVVQGGKPFVCPPDRQLAVTFIAVEVKDESGKSVANGEPYPAQLDPADGKFIVPGRDGRGIPPGRYRIALTQRPTAEAISEAWAKAGKKRSPINRKTDYFKSQYSAANSPILRVLETSCELMIDLDRPTEDGVGR